MGKLNDFRKSQPDKYTQLLDYFMKPAAIPVTSKAS